MPPSKGPKKYKFREGELTIKDLSRALGLDIEALRRAIKKHSNADDAVAALYAREDEAAGHRAPRKGAAPAIYNVDGIEMTVADIAKASGVDPSTVRRRIRETGDAAEAFGPAKYNGDKDTPMHDEELMAKVMAWMQTHHRIPDTAQICQMGEWKSAGSGLAFIERMIEQGKMYRDDDGNTLVEGLWLSEWQVNGMICTVQETASYFAGLLETYDGHTNEEQDPPEITTLRVQLSMLDAVLKILGAPDAAVNLPVTTE